MYPVPLLTNERARLASLADLGVLDSAAEPEFDALVKAAALICGTPISLVSLVDRNRQWFKANIGLPGVTETPRDVAFCAHAINGDRLFEIPDATVDLRFADNPLVTAGPGIRFYAGAPLRLSTGAQVGTLCVIDRKPRLLTDVQREALSCLAEAAVKALEGRLATQKLQAAVRSAEAKAKSLRLIIDAVPSKIAYWDRDLNCVFANQVYEKWFAIGGDRLVGINLRDLYGPDLFALNKPHIDAVLDGNEQAFERQVNCPDSISRHILVHYVPDFVDGEVAGFLVQASDVSALKNVEHSFQEAQRLGRIGSWEWSPQSDTVTWSAELFHIMGRNPAGPAPAFADQAQLYVPESWERLHAAVEQAMVDGEAYCLELEYQRPDRTSGWLEARGEVIFGAPGCVAALRGTVQDITTRRAMLAEIAEQHELLRVTLQSIGDAVITTNSQGQVTSLNPVAAQLVGCQADLVTGRSLIEVFQIFNEHTRLASSNPIEEILEQSHLAGAEEETILVAKDGRKLSIECSAAPIRSKTGDALGNVLVFRDVTKQREQSKDIAYRAQHDSLTGLVNREEFERRLERSLAKAKSEGAVHTLMYLDLDQFKIVNDTCGHAAGDKLLKVVSSHLSSVARQRDTVARLGGDEFAILLEHCSLQNAQEIARIICNRLNDSRFIHDERRFRIGASIGLVPIDARWDEPSAIMQAADRSCYAAKEGGRNRVHTWFEADEVLLERQCELQWAARLESAFDEGRFHLFAQRIFPSVGAGLGQHLEVLLRLIENDGTVISPGAFLPTAERFDMAARIDRLVLKMVVGQLVEHPDLAKIDTVCVNISGQSIGDRAFHRKVFSILRAAGAAICKRICLEITETAAITNLTSARVFIEQVKQLGIRIALDDFGAGAATFSYLKSLPIDVLKIDGQFVRDLGSDPLNEAAIRCFVDVARVMGVKVIAECVETDKVFSRLAAMGVDHVQGYLFHRPEPLELVLYPTEAIAAE